MAGKRILRDERMIKTIMKEEYRRVHYGLTPEGHRYEGDIVFDRPDGQGAMFSQNGDVYEGQRHKGVIHDLVSRLVS